MHTRGTLVSLPPAAFTRSLLLTRTSFAFWVIAQTTVERTPAEGPAAELLAGGGRLVSVVCKGPFFRSDQKSVAFREWLDDLGAAIEQLPEDAFQGVDAFRQTGVRTRLVALDKPKS